MSFSGGVYTLPSGNPVVTNTTISSSWANTTLSDIATALSTCVLKDGTQTITANIPMSNFKFTGLAAGSSTQDSATIGGAETFTGKTLTNPANTKQALTDGATVGWDASSGGVATWTIAGNRTLSAPTNLKTGGRYVLIVTQDGTGGRTITWNAVYIAQGSGTMPQPNSTAASVTTFVFDSPDGTNLYLHQDGAILDTNPVVYGGTDTTKKVRIEVDGLTTATTRVWTAPDKDITVLGVEDSATQAQMEAVTATGVFVSPARQIYHPAMPQAWAVFDGTTTGANAPTTGYGVTSITRNSTGNYTVGFSFAFAAANYGMIGTGMDEGSTNLSAISRINGGTYTTTAFQFGAFHVSDIISRAATDLSWITIAFFGKQ